jgi:hypothetical protein
MGSYYDLRVGGYSILSAKWPIDEVILSLFVEADKVNSLTSPDLPSPCANVHENDEFIGYRSTAAAIADRLDVMGFTPERAKADFLLLLKNEIADELELAEGWTSRKAEGEIYAGLSADAEDEIRFLSELSFEKWVGAIRRLKKESIRWPGFNSIKGTYARELDSLETHILNAGRNNEHPHLGFYCSDHRFLVRAFTMCAELSDLVVLDCTDLVRAGYFDAGEPVATQARASITAGARAVEKILVLTEGRSDTRILEATLEALYPHLCEFLSFLDHDSFSVPGGAGNLDEPASRLGWCGRIEPCPGTIRQ